MRKYLRGWAAAGQRNGVRAMIVVEARDVVQAERALADFTGADRADAEPPVQVCVEPWALRARYVAEFTRETFGEWNVR